MTPRHARPPITGDLQIDRLTVRYGDRRVLDQACLDVASGEIVALLGRSGSGKSTLLRTIAGLISPDSGRVSIGGVDQANTPPHRRRVGLVFQDEQLFPHLNVLDNVAFGLKMAGRRRSERYPRADQLLDLVGLTGFGGRTVETLSGGEAKRVAVARALAPAPTVLLLDEPLTGLDSTLQRELEVDVVAAIRRQHTTAMWVTHDEREATTVSDRIIRLDHGVVT